MFLNRYGDRISDARIYEIVARLKEADLPHTLPTFVKVDICLLNAISWRWLGFITDELGHVIGYNSCLCQNSY